jgi:hypothetical protein
MDTSRKISASNEAMALEDTNDQQIALPLETRATIRGYAAIKRSGSGCVLPQANGRNDVTPRTKPSRVKTGA